jgi:hypothetical protein
VKRIRNGSYKQKIVIPGEHRRESGDAREGDPGRSNGRNTSQALQINI